MVAVYLLLGAVAAHAQFNYTTNSDRTISITGYTGSGGAVTIPAAINGLPVTGIADYAFYELLSVTSLALPGTLTNIGTYSFYNCANLASATMPAGLVNIGSYTFEGCGSLTNVVIPNTVTSMGSEVFGYCSNLASVTLSSKLATLGFGELWGCASLTNVTIPRGVTSIGDYAFSDCTGLTNVAIPPGVTNIGYGTFWNCASLNTVNIPRSVMIVGDYAFYLCANLNSVRFNGNAPGADSSVFANDRATAYYMPGATGWGSSFGGIPTAMMVLPYPLILQNNAGFGIQSNQFGFTVSWATNLSVVVEACTSLANSVWQPLQTNTLTNGWFYFSDAQWTNYPARFYRITTTP